MKDVSIRKAIGADLGAINDIYNYYVAHSTCTYQSEPSTAAERAKWFDDHKDPYFVTVAEINGQVIGWASVSRYHPRAAYGKTVENSVYIHHEWQHKGIGKTLLEDLIKRAKKAGFHTIIAAISSDQIPSVKLHEKFGFSHGGKINEVGNKFGRWLDVSYMQLML
jgi:L-amino acid N-acyltransferase YncA